MESKANYALIGAFVLISVFAIMAFVAYLSNRQLDQQYNQFMVVYDSPPRGISVGSEVRFNGLQMGEVIQTELNPDDPNEVLVLIQVSADTPVMEDTYAQNEPLGVTGMSYIQLFAGNSTTRLVPKNSKDIPRIKGQGSQIDQILGGGESMMKNANIAISRVVTLMDDQAVEDFHGILSNIETITQAVAESDLSSERIEEFLQKVEAMSEAIGSAAQSIQGTANGVTGILNQGEINGVLSEAQQTLTTVRSTFSSFQNFAEKGSALSDEALNSVEQFSLTGLSDLSTALADLKELMGTLNIISEEIQHNPAALIVGDKKQEMELPQ